MLLLVTSIAHAGTIFDDDWLAPSPQSTKTTTPSERSGRHPIPGLAEQLKTRQLLKDVFANYLVDHSVSARRALAQKLLDEAAKEGDAPTDRFVLLVGAASAGREASDVTLCFRAADNLSNVFDIDGLHFKADCALKMSLKAESPVATTKNCRAVVELVDQLAAANDYATASKLLTALRPAAAADPSLNQEVQSRSKEIDALRVGAETIRTAVEKLKTAPADPKANLAVGTYECLTMGDWHSGLAMLARGSDDKLSRLAKEELSAPTTPDAIIRLADGWWDLAATQGDVPRRRLVQHAATLYSKAKAAGLTGLGLILAEKRIAQAPPVEKPIVPTSPLPGGARVVNLLPLIDPAQDAVLGDWRIKKNALVSPSTEYARLRIPYAVPEEYDFHVRFTHTSRLTAMVQLLCHDGKRFAWHYGMQGGTKHGFGLMSEKEAWDNDTTAPALPADKTTGTVHDSLVQVRRGYVAAYIDGRLISRHDTDFSDMTLEKKLDLGSDSIGLGTWQTVATFSVVELVEITGRGHPLRQP
jgi:hypothetical protein